MAVNVIALKIQLGKADVRMKAAQNLMDSTYIGDAAKRVVLLDLLRQSKGQIQIAIEALNEEP